MTKQAIGLSYAVRFRVVFKYFGQLCLVLAALTLLPLVVSLFFADFTLTLRYGEVIAALSLFGGLALLSAPDRIQVNEGLVVVALIFLVTPLVMSYPMLSAELGFLDALFEAISSVTTTGLSMNPTVAGESPTFLFTRAWIQWYGGLGIIVFSLALVTHPGVLAKGLFVTEAEADDLAGGTRAHARRVLIVYSVLTALGIGISWLAGIDFFDAVLYTFAAVSTGGFAPHDASLATLTWPAQLCITLLCLSGAIPLMLYYRVLMEKRKRAVDFLQLKAIILAALIVFLALGVTMRLSTAMPWSQIIHHAPLLALSAQTTAGFSSLAVDQLDAGSKLVLIFSMLIGGGAGSTAGGFKLLRLLIAISVLRLLILRTCLTKHAVIEPNLAGRRLHGEEIQSALLLIVLYIFVIALSWLPFVAMGYSPLDSLFEVVSATGTVGLSVGITDASLPPILKGILCADMLLGRLEIMAWLAMIYPGMWFGRRMEGV